MHSGSMAMTTRKAALLSFCSAVALAGLVTLLHAKGDLSRQDPITVTVDLGAPGKHAFIPDRLTFETGKLYKLVLRNSSSAPHYFTSHAFSAMVWTRKAQVTMPQGDKTVTLAEFKGPMREIEVYPGTSAEWWFVPVAAGKVTDLRCDIRGPDGKTHAEQGMTGEIIIE